MNTAIATVEPAAEPVTRPQTLPSLQREVARVLNVESVGVDTGLAELGIDSLNVVELILLCEHIYGRPVDDSALTIDQYTTLRELDRQLLAST